VVVALGSVTGTVKDTIDEYEVPVGLATLTMYRPFPAAEVRQVLADAEHVIVLERAFAPGAGGVVSADVRMALGGTAKRISTVVAGLGGRAVTKASLSAMLDDAHGGRLPDLSFLDLRTDVVAREIARLDVDADATDRPIDAARIG
jgi:pyruvate ferredoxin oxidoreductase alpha subunit